MEDKHQPACQTESANRENGKKIRLAQKNRKNGNEIQKRKCHRENGKKIRLAQKRDTKKRRNGHRHGQRF